MPTMVDEEVAVGSNAQDERIFVAIRVRPLSDKERDRNDVSDWEFYNDNTIVLKNGHMPEVFTFDRVFGGNCSTREVYESGIKEVALSVVRGINSSIFAYGQTSSGKTYTMCGVTESAVSDIYDYIQMHRNREFAVKFSAVEIYNEVVTDLLSEDAAALRLLDDREKGTVIERLTEQILKDKNHLEELISICEAQRKTGETCLNQTSSRSHQILRLTVESSYWDYESSGNSGTLTASVSFVDLAGSERASQTLSAGARLREGSHINRSLLTLGTVIRKLSKGGSGHIPYRDSKLTRILQNSLGGNARTAIICTASPARSHVDQSRNTLVFASCAKEVTNNAQVNLLMSDKVLIKQLRRELEKLENEMKNLAPSSMDSSSILSEKELLIEQMAKEIEELSRQRDLAQSRIQTLLESIGQGQPLGVDEHSACKSSTAVSEHIEELTDRQNIIKSDIEAMSLLSQQDMLLTIDQEKPMGSSSVKEQKIKRTTPQKEIAQSWPDNFPTPVGDLAQPRIQTLLESIGQGQSLGVVEHQACKSSTSVSEDVEELTDQQNMIKFDIEAMSLLSEQDMLLTIDQTKPVGSSAAEEQKIKRMTPQKDIAQSCPDNFPSPVEHKRLMRISTCPALDSQPYAENIMNDLEGPTYSSNNNQLNSETCDDCLSPHSCHDWDQKDDENDAKVRCKMENSKTDGEAQLSTSVSEKTEGKSSHRIFKAEDGAAASRELDNEVDDITADYTSEVVKQKVKNLERTITKLISLLPSEESPVAMDNEIIIPSPNNIGRGDYSKRRLSFPKYPSARRLSQISDLSATLEEECAIDSDEDTTDINFMQRMNDKDRLQFKKDFDEIMVKAKAPSSSEPSTSPKDTSMHVAEGACYLNSKNLSSDLERQWRDIIKLWDACNVPLVHRTHFFILFKGDPSDSPYLEVELRRLCFLRDSFATRTETVEDNQKITWVSSAKALNKERKMLSKQIHKKFWRKEKEGLYESWGINLKSKYRSVQLAWLLWSRTQDMDHTKESADLVAKLVGLQKQNQAPKEMLGLTFSPRKHRRTLSWKDSMALLSYHL